MDVDRCDTAPLLFLSQRGFAISFALPRFRVSLGAIGIFRITARRRHFCRDGALRRDKFSRSSLPPRDTYSRRRRSLPGELSFDGPLVLFLYAAAYFASDAADFSEFKSFIAISFKIRAWHFTHDEEPHHERQARSLSLRSLSFLAACAAVIIFR